MVAARRLGSTLRFISFAVNYPRPSPVRRVAIPLGGAGLFLVEEAEWQRQRKLLAPTFTPSSINVLAPHFHAATGAPSRPLPRHP